ncbi:hypothetical protein H4R19_004738, partial [Coemansia spiralis]
QSNGATQFMDEESAANYQQILALRKQSNRPRVESQTSADGLPDDPLSRVAARPEEDNAAQQLDRSRVRRAQRVSESESNDEELSILDRRAVLPHRLRTRPAVSAVRRRFEEARRNVHRPVCNSGSDSDTMPTVEDALCLGGAGDTRRPALPQLDMPETDSETEKNKPCPVLVIRDSSDDDDDDFISDPDDLPNRPRPTNRAAMDKFLSSFEPMREARARRRSGQRTGAALLREPAGADIRRNPQSAHPSQALDDDLADFIIDDDDDGGGGDGSKGAGHAELDGESNSSAAGVDDSHLPGTVFTLDRPQGAMALMPEEFSQLDLPTSFKIYTQYLVYWIANDRTKPELSYENARYFYLAYITVARVVDSIEQSLVASSAWLDDFRVNLNRYPEYAAEGIASVPGCEACHFRQNRTATFRVTLSGTPYSRLELAPPRPAESPAAGDADSDTASVTDGDEVDDMLASFNVGRTCKQRSELCHELHHYFYHLAYYVDVALLPVRSERGSQDPSDLDPDDLVTMLEDQGVIDRLFREFKSLLSRAKAGFVT